MTPFQWNVGVASRGRLRGQSIPVKFSDEQSPSDTSPTKAAFGSPPQANEVKERASPPRINASFPAPIPNHNHNAAYLPMHQNSLPGQHFSMSPEWQMHAPPAPHVSHSAPDFPKQQYPMLHLHHLQTTSIPPNFDGFAFSQSSGSTGSYLDDYQSPLDWTMSPTGASFTEAFPPVRTGSYTSQPASFLDSSHIFPAHSDPYPSPHDIGIDPLQDFGEYQDMPTLYRQPSEQSIFDMNIFEPTTVLPSPPAEQNQMALFDIPEATREDEEVAQPEPALTIFDGRFSSPFFHLDGKLRTLMEYYDRHVCPWIVAFDGPENPYRKHILLLACESPALQQALAALSENNQRMRLEQPAGFIEDSESGPSSPVRRPSSPTASERMYKSQACELLNKQLKEDPHAAQDDSVLATILVLCLFSVCDSGFSNFTTQLEGVQRILSRRDPNTQSEFTKWVQMFFIWFDVMTSAVNEREMQITGHGLNWDNLHTNMGALEEFSGCDGRLFKLIAKLGRLSCLAQGKNVQPTSAIGSQAARAQLALHPQDNLRPRDQEGRPRSALSRSAHRPFFRRSSRSGPACTTGKISLEDFDKLAGSGWGSDWTDSFTLLSGQSTGTATPDRRQSESAATPTFPDERRQFWTEWQEIRTMLQGWRPEVPALACPEAAQEAGKREMEHINESFRYAALLYTERLGEPMLPSASAAFQQHVRAGMAHISALPVDSCVTKFLLWPLFLLGTECVDEEHRELIRARCIAIHRESGFYNNLSGLEVLEKIWAEMGSAPGAEAAEIIGRQFDYDASRKGAHGQALRWRKVMNRSNGEYIVI